MIQLGSCCSFALEVAQRPGPGASTRIEGDGNIGSEKAAPGVPERSSADRGAAADRRSDEAPDRAEKSGIGQRAESPSKKESGAAKDERAGKENGEDSGKVERAGKGIKEPGSASTGADTGESGRSSTDERKSDTGAKTHVSLSGDKRARIESVFRSHKSGAKANVNINIEARVGVVMPRRVTLIDVPEDVVIIVPEWRAYKYIVIGGVICIVDPDTYEIVDIIVAA
jgi:uncharacterized protein DUF1236